MAFEKGKSGNPSGRPKGTPNKANSEFKDALNSLLRECSPKIQLWIDQVAETDPAKALDHLARLAEYVHPKLARTDVTMASPDGGPVEHSMTVKFVE